MFLASKGFKKEDLIIVAQEIGEVLPQKATVADLKTIILKMILKNIKSLNRCDSQVGRIGGKQQINLGGRCWFLGTVIHELGHALGFYHEHNRSDRDDYLIVYKENVREGDEHNFNKIAPHQNILYNNYDYDSIMHYGNVSMSKNSKQTMEAINGHPLKEPFEKPGMTESDIERVKKMYHCA
nr:astacin-like metalloprotease toxin 4 [Parasteatoda tepidariorum]